jgi:hypothetical protein
MHEIQKELERIRKRHGGVLRPVDVVETARDPENILHPRFEWDDEKAGEQYRLLQARQLIRVSVVVLDNGDDEPVKAYWSYQEERYNRAGGGYTAMVDILRDEERYALMLEEAKNELSIFRQKYKQLKELASVIGEIDKLVPKQYKKTGS